MAVPPPLAHHLLASLREVLSYNDAQRPPGRVAVAVAVDAAAVTLTVTEDGTWWADPATADGTERVRARTRAGQHGGTVTPARRDGGEPSSAGGPHRPGRPG